MATGLLDFLTTVTTNSIPSRPPRPDDILFDRYLQHGGLPRLPTMLVYVSSDGDTQKIKPRPDPDENPPSPDTLLLFLRRALRLCPLLPLPTRFTRIPPLKVIAIARNTRETHCVLCLYLRRMQHLVIYSRLYSRQTEETPREEHSTLWDDGIGPRRSQCLYLTGH